MTRKSKFAIAGALAGLLGSVAIVGAVQADRDRGYGGDGPRHMMMDGRGAGPQGARGDERRGWREAHDRRGGWRGHHGRGGHGGFGRGGEMMRHMFGLVDADKDGKVTQAEIDEARESRFAQYDADKNGKLSVDEFENLFREITRPMMVRAFQHLDPDGDAALTSEELAARSKDIVKRLDRNGDDALSLEDHRARRGWHRWGGGSDKEDDSK